MMKKNEIKIGMQVIFERAYVGATYGTVLAVEKDRVKICDEYNYKIYCRFENIYANGKEYYKESIKDVNDLIKFMYDNVVSKADEYTNWEARDAVKERAKELLNIDFAEYKEVQADYDLE